MPERSSHRALRSLALGALILVSAAAAIPALAQIPSWNVDDFKAPADPEWRERTARDVGAAYRFLKENHPGAVPELHDAIFVNNLEASRALAAERAKAVTSIQGYNAVLAGFATGLEDKHIWSRPTFVTNVLYWTGGVIGKRGDDWVVVASDGTSASPPQGARLLSCDGVDASTLAQRNLGGFRAAWRIEAQQYQAAPWLLVDEGNPFIRRPATCMFENAGKRVPFDLQWRRIKREELLPKLRAAGGGGAAGFGIRKVGQGYWIALQNLVNEGAAVAKEAEARQTELRAAPFVVVDVRGNGGGSAFVANRIAAVLWGTDRISAIGDRDDDDCGDDLRATAGNVAQMTYLLKVLASTYTPADRAFMEQQIAMGREALAHGRTFNRPPVCKTAAALPDGSAPASPVAPAPGFPKVVLVTDNLCFSACLVLADEFRRLGAFHVGRTTDAATRYTDVREQYLPSGYSLFSTLQAVAPGEPPEVGPFRPERMYGGDMADTAALERWVLSQLARPVSS